MATRATPAATERVAGSRPGILRATAVVLLLVAIALLKPWGGTGVGVPAERTVAAASPITGRDMAAADAGVDAAAARLAPAPSVGPNQIACDDAAWQVASLDRLADWTARTLVPAEPRPASGPLDPAVPALVLESPAVLGVGGCGPSDGGDGAGATGVSQGVGLRVVGAWRVAAGRAVPFAVEPIDAVPAGVDPAIAVLYRPPADPALGTSGRVAWPTGRFVLELAPVDPATGAATLAARRFIAIVVR